MRVAEKAYIVLMLVDCDKMLMQAKENVTVKVTGTNSGGLLANIIGLSLFIPASHMQAEGAKKRQRWQVIVDQHIK